MSDMNEFDLREEAGNTSDKDIQCDIHGPRVIAGVGIPQLSAVYNVAQAIKGSEIPVIADGGIQHSGDVTKAIGAGAHAIMIGSLFAGTDETPGETFLYQGRTYKGYRGRFVRYSRIRCTVDIVGIGRASNIRCGDVIAYAAEMRFSIILSLQEN